MDRGWLVACGFATATVVLARVRLHGRSGRTRQAYDGYHSCAEVIRARQPAR